mmetsp:Transcript_14734/g.22512  ORF Transcript_14734/g.22512 Transcript_14734/m.22512 type:complete len:382 (-) Transcript_14734:242-1387(-)
MSRSTSFVRLTAVLLATTQRHSPTSVESLSAPPPLPPYTFTNARVLYQPTFVPVRAARAAPTPTDGLTLLSLFGWTLGGVFVAEWETSPVGKYREVAVLSGIVARFSNDTGFRLELGAWASHIVVTTDPAVAAGRKQFGLPAKLGNVEFASSSGHCEDPDDGNFWLKDSRNAAASVWRTGRRFAEDVAVGLKCAVGAAAPGIAEPAERLRKTYSDLPTSINSAELVVIKNRANISRGFCFASDNTCIVQGWDGFLPLEVDNNKIGRKAADGFALSLPSFSGRLSREPPDDYGSGGDTKETSTSPLLRYVLKLGPARRIRLRPSMPTFLLREGYEENATFREGNDTVLSGGLRGVLEGPCACPCIQIDGVRVVAGLPEVIAP